MSVRLGIIFSPHHYFVRKCRVLRIGRIQLLKTFHHRVFVPMRSKIDTD